MTKLFQKKFAKLTGGYTLLFAMIVASVVLIIGVSLLTVSTKEFLLSSSATYSADAFYAADSGATCAKYWDANTKAFSTSTSPQNPNAIACQNAGSAQPISECWGTNPPNLPECGGIPTYPGEVPNPNPSGVSVYRYVLYMPFSTDGTSNKNCAAVTIDKYVFKYADPKSGATFIYPYTTVTSSGYNLGWNTANPVVTGISDCSSASPKKVERTIVYSY